jgi:hypothetical protein
VAAEAEAQRVEEAFVDRLLCAVGKVNEEGMQRWK